jgi:AmiR/NasT family two-component response regulator
MASERAESLRILIANGRRDRFEQVAQTVANLGHEAIPRHVDLAAVGAVTAAERPDVAIVIVGESSEHSLGLISKIVREAACPVIALLDVEDPEFIKEAAKQGVFAYITHGEAQELQSSFDIALRRFAEYHNLEGAFARRAITERAKGILMERHSVPEEEAFSMLRTNARRTNRKVVDIAEAVVLSHQLLPGSRSGVAEVGEEVAAGADLSH